MKKLMALLLAALLLLPACCPSAAASGWTSSENRSGSSGSLSPRNICPITPTIYSMRRYRKNGQGQAYDINKDFSSDTIVRQQGFLEYGLYIKFTPGRTDDGYRIRSIGMVLSDPWGSILREDEDNDVDITCKYRYYWSWDFYSLDSVFSSMISDYGYIPTGVYTIDIYFNHLWAGKTQFRVQR